MSVLQCLLWVASLWHVHIYIAVSVILNAKLMQVSFETPYVIWCEFTWSCGGMRGGKMAVLKHASLMPNCLTPGWTWIKSRYHPFPFVLPHVFCQEYGLVSCKPLSSYTPNREALMRVPWPWIKASHPVRGHGCFRLGPRGGHPLERAYINLIPCYSRLWSPRLKSFSWTMSRVIPSIER